MVALRSFKAKGAGSTPVGGIMNKIKDRKAHVREYMRKYMREKYAIDTAHRAVQKRVADNLRFKRKLWVAHIKNILGCEKCDETDPDCLDFHHLDPTIKLRCISRMTDAKQSQETIMIEMNKCIVLCANCHRKEEAKMRRKAENDKRFFRIEMYQL